MAMIVNGGPKATVPDMDGMRAYIGDLVLSVFTARGEIARLNGAVLEKDAEIARLNTLLLERGVSDPAVPAGPAGLPGQIGRDDI